MSEIGQQLIQAVRKAAAEKPDYVYQKPPRQNPVSGIQPCMYVYEGQPSCLIGKAAWDLGLIDATFESNSENEGGVETFADALGLALELEESAWLETAQNNQDTGQAWGIAVDNADQEVPLPLQV